MGQQIKEQLRTIAPVGPALSAGHRLVAVFRARLENGASIPPGMTRQGAEFLVFRFPKLIDGEHDHKLPPSLPIPGFMKEIQQEPQEALGSFNDYVEALRKLRKEKGIDNLPVAGIPLTELEADKAKDTLSALRQRVKEKILNDPNTTVKGLNRIRALMFPLNNEALIFGLNGEANYLKVSFLKHLPNQSNGHNLQEDSLVYQNNEVITLHRSHLVGFGFLEVARRTLPNPNKTKQFSTVEVEYAKTLLLAYLAI